MSREKSNTSINYSIEYAKTHLKRVPLDLRKEEYTTLKETASSIGMSVNGFIKEAIRDKIRNIHHEMDS